MYRHSEDNVSRARKTSTRLAGPSRRTKIVWMSFFGAMTIVTGLLTLQESNYSGHRYLAATSIGLLGDRPLVDPLFQIEAPLDNDRWTGIVIHHTGEPAGDPETINRIHQSRGYRGLGFHFLIGNGNGLGNGVIHVGYRWNSQLPGAHVAGLAGELHNQRSIGICLIGNGDRRSFTDAQMTQLINLIQRLQRELSIPADQVYLHRELASGITSPGQFFSSAELQEQLLDLPR